MYVLWPVSVTLVFFHLSVTILYSLRMVKLVIVQRMTHGSFLSQMSL